MPSLPPSLDGFISKFRGVLFVFDTNVLSFITEIHLPNANSVDQDQIP